MSQPSLAVPLVVDFVPTSTVAEARGALRRPQRAAPAMPHELAIGFGDLTVPLAVLALQESSEEDRLEAAAWLLGDLVHSAD